jgi:hypothetical protein
MTKSNIDKELEAQDKQLANIEKQVSHIRAMLMGNGVIGIAEMARRTFDWMLLQKKTKNGLLDWTFRGIITLLLGYVAINIGCVK